MQRLTALRPSNRYLFFGLASLSLMMFSIDVTIVAVALPSMMLDLQTSLTWIGWTITAYVLSQTVMMPLAGKLSESYGHMRVFLACVVVFTLGSLLCGLATNVYLLIIFRVLQALGGGGFMPSAVAVVVREFPEQRGRMIGLFVSIFPVGGIIGPNLGGFILEHFSWRAAFLVNVPIGMFIIAFLLRRALQRPEGLKRRRIDLLGAGLFAAGITALLCAVTFLGEDASYWRTLPFWALLSGSLLLLTLFVFQERRVDEPVIDLSLVVRHPFLAVNVYNLLFGAAVFGAFSFIPYFAVVQYGFGPVESGAVLTPRSLMIMSTAAISSIFIIRLGYRLPMLVGLLLVIVSMTLLSQGWSELTIAGVRFSSFWVLAAEVMLGGLGLGLAAPASNNAALDLLPDRAALITGIRGMFRSTGGVLGTALIVLALELSPDKAAGMRMVFQGIAVVLLISLPLIFLIPDTARAKYQQSRRDAAQATAPQQPQPAGTPVAGPGVGRPSG